MNKNNSIRNFPIAETLLFLAVIVIQCVYFIYLTFNHRIAQGHDGLGLFSLQYYFLNNAVFSGDIAQWMPFMTQGTVASWWQVIAGGLLQNCLLLAAPLLKGINFLTLFNASMFVDELLLLVGTWLLTRRFFSPITVFFVSVTMVGSAIWMDQPWFNFRFYYALPLILHYLHAFIEQGKWRYIFLSLNLLAIQMVGNLPYLIPVTSLVIFLYTVTFCIFNFSYFQEQVKKIGFGFSAILAIVGGLLSLFVVYQLLQTGTESIFNHNIGRNLDGTTNLEGFLGYGGGFDFNMWKEIFFGISPGMDRTFYIGILPLAMILIGIILSKNRKKNHIILFCGIWVLFSAGSVVATLFYHIWPMMKFFRHLALSAVMVKPFLCILAGFGFEIVFVEDRNTKGLRLGSVFIVAVALALTGLSALHFYLANDYTAAMKLIESYNKIFGRGYYEFESSLVVLASPMKMVFTESVLHWHFQKTGVLILLLAALIGSAPFVTKRTRIHLVVLILVVHFFDIFSYKIFETNSRTTQLPKQYQSLNTFQEVGFSKKRDLFFWNNNPRAVMMRDIVPFRGVMHWSLHSFLFKDQGTNPFRTDHWLKPLHDLRQLYLEALKSKIEPRQKASLEKLLSVGAISYFPFIRRSFWLEIIKYFSSAAKISGISEDKIQIFSQASYVEEEQMKSLLINKDFTGDQLFVRAELGRKLDHPSPEGNTRLRVPYVVEQFDANHVKISVEIKDHTAPWLFYSDLWHPLWKARVNDVEVPVSKAYIAYKAVPLQQGKNQVHFYFSSKKTFIQQVLVNMNSLLWILGLFYLSARIVCRGRKENTGKVSLKILILYIIIIGAALSLVGRHPESLFEQRKGFIEHVQKYYDGTQTMLNQNKLLEAQRYYQKASGVVTHKALAHMNLGFIYFYQKEYSHAFGQYQKALKSDPRLYMSYYDAGLLSYKLGKFGQAELFFQNSLKVMLNTRMSFEQLHNFFQSSNIQDMEEAVSVLLKRQEVDYKKAIILLADIQSKAYAQDITDKDFHFFGSTLKQFFIQYSLYGMNLYDLTATDDNCVFSY